MTFTWHKILLSFATFPSHCYNHLGFHKFCGLCQKGLCLRLGNPLPNFGSNLNQSWQFTITYRSTLKTLPLLLINIIFSTLKTGQELILSCQGTCQFPLSPSGGFPGNQSEPRKGQFLITLQLNYKIHALYTSRPTWWFLFANLSFLPANPKPFKCAIFTPL